MIRTTTFQSLFIAALLVVALTFVGAPAFADVKTQTVEYKQGDANLKSYLAYDNDAPMPVGAAGTKRPGILVVPEWWGLNDYAKFRAGELAKLGYVALAVDVYGDGESTTDPKRAGELATKYKTDRPLLRERVKAALGVLQKQSNVSPDKIAAIGYCFGGTSVLELARSGAPVVGVVSFHGGLDAPATPEAGDIKAKILVCHGGADPYSKEDQIKAFIDELNARHADWQMIVYAGANHGFTNKNNEKLHIPGVGYDAKADARSWLAMKDFFNEIFAK